jgi:hypothetical protein
MSDPITFDATTPRFALPMLYAGQAQKELYVNEGFSITDALLHCAIESEAATPPTSPADGQNWLVGTGATGAWTGQSGKLACRQGGQWIYVQLRDGMRLISKSSGQDMRRLGGVWHAPAAPAQPTGGSVVDSQARESINLLLQRLRDAGIFPAE